MSLSRENSVSENKDDQGFYRIKVKGILDAQWSDWFDGMAVMPYSNQDTLLIGLIRDQAALYGILNKIRDLGLTLLSVERLDTKKLNEGGS
jgi:hypothetical protein